MGSKQAAHQKASPKGGSTRAELKTVRIDAPVNRAERRARKRAIDRGTAIVVSESREGVEPS